MRATVEQISAYKAWCDSQQDPWDGEEFERLQAESLEYLDAMANEALHDAIYAAGTGVREELSSGKFDFYTGDSFNHEIPALGERVELAKIYGSLIVEGSVDAVSGRTARLYRLIGRELDVPTAEDCLTDYFWRFLLDMSGVDVFEYVFIEAWASPHVPYSYMLVDMQTVRQFRYPEMHEDCVAAAADFYEAAGVSGFRKRRAGDV